MGTFSRATQDKSRKTLKEGNSLKELADKTLRSNETRQRIEENRCTGKTTRLILEAIICASEGKHVQFITSNHWQAKEVCRIGYNWANYIMPDVVTAKREQIIIGSGVIDFIPQREARHETRTGAKIIKDINP
jgi:hypothetical protein